MIEIVQTRGEILPTVAAIAPTENNTRAGVPAANQKACVQFSVRTKECDVSPPAACVGTCGNVVSVIVRSPPGGRPLVLFFPPYSFLPKVKRACQDLID